MFEKKIAELEEKLKRNSNETEKTLQELISLKERQEICKKNIFTVTCGCGAMIVLNSEYNRRKPIECKANMDCVFSLECHECGSLYSLDTWC